MLIEHIISCASLINKKTKQLFVLFVGLFLFSSFLELIGISLIFPIVKILGDRNFFQTNEYVGIVKNYFNINTEKEFAVYACLGLVGILTFKAIYCTVLVYFNNKVFADRSVTLSVRLYRAYITAPMDFLNSHNSSDLLRNLNQSVTYLYNGSIQVAIQIVTELITAIGLMCLLIYADPLAAIVSIIIAIMASLIFSKFVASPTKRLAQKQHDLSAATNKIILESLHGAAEIRILGKEEFFENNFENVRSNIAKTARFFQTLQQLPRYYLEILVGVMIASVVIFHSGENSTADLTALLALYGAAALRIMPAAGRIMALTNQLRIAIPEVHQLKKNVSRFGRWLIEDENDSTNSNFYSSSADEQNAQVAKSFSDTLELRNVSHSYNNQVVALSNINLKIYKGSSVGLVGPSGAGKSSLASVLLGLTQPDSGMMLVDGSEIQLGRPVFRKLVGYVPQNVFLLGSSIRENIAFGVEENETDYDRIWQVLNMVQLEKHVRNLPDGIETHVGERGVLFSGGQRQRIGIARALYFDPNILIFDEATSSLDVETENNISLVLSELKKEKTLIVIAHRLSTLKDCNVLHFMNDGKIVASGSFLELIEKNKDFRHLVELAKLNVGGSEASEIKDILIDN